MNNLNVLRVCHECGEVIPADVDMIYADGHYYCENCAEDVLHWCEHCEEYHTSTNEVIVSDWGGCTEKWCDGCVECDAYECDCCGDLYDSQNLFYMECDGNTICSNCRDDEYEYCHECGEWVRNEHYNYDLDMCYCCGDDRNGDRRIQGYHGGPALRFFGNGDPNRDGALYGLGVELEVDIINNKSRYSEGSANFKGCLDALDSLAGEHYHYEHDCSVDEGFELVTQPHTVEAFYEMPWAEILGAMRDNGFISHDSTNSCGLHVHFSREMFGADFDTQSVAISKMIQFFELYWADILKMSRRTEEQANHWASRYMTINRREIESIAKKERSLSRYMAINNTNTNTVEIRIMRGTLRYETFMATIDFLVNVVKNSCRIGWDVNTDDKEWLRGMKPETLGYLRSQGAFYGSATALLNEIQ